MRGGCNNEHSFPEGGKKFGWLPPWVVATSSESHPLAQACTLIFTIYDESFWARAASTIVLLRYINSPCVLPETFGRRRHDRYCYSPLENLFSLRVARVSNTWRNKARHRSLHGSVRFLVHRGLACFQTGGIEASLGIKKLPRQFGNPLYYTRLLCTSFHKITYDIDYAIKLPYNHCLKWLING